MSLSSPTLPMNSTSAKVSGPQTALWERPVRFLRGIGPQRAEALAALGIHTVADLLLNLPRRYLDRSLIAPIAKVVEGQTVTVVGEIISAGFLYGRKKRFEAVLDDGTGRIPLVWFSGHRYLKDTFKKGVRLTASGTVVVYREPQLVHPECEFLGDEDADDLTHTGRVVPIYPSGDAWRRAGLASRALRRVLKPIIDDEVPSLPDHFDPVLLEALGFPTLNEAITQVHFPESLVLASRARKRLAFDELFFFEWSMAQHRLRIDAQRDGRPCRSEGTLAARIVESLPWPLTAAQERVGSEILRDMRDTRAMRRLLQGDVGAGKTIVAALAMAHWIEDGAQAALLVPTEILAEQHHHTLARLFGPLGIVPVLLTGSLGATARRDAHEAIASGTARLIVGTHALLTASVAFSDLGMIVIDEQHRFGVAQRQTLVSKGHRPDLLVMTATPIPRTLAMTYYGDLDVSVLNELPPRKGTTQTVWRSEEAREKIYEFIAQTTADQNVVYIVYPLVEESEKLDLKAAVAGFEHLRERFADRRVGLIHGRTPVVERSETMRRFYRGAIDILVATTVIEVGVDAPDARLMVIENADRFGLSQLHQLRGRIGRGPGRSICVLMLGRDPTPIAKERLEVMCATSDGFQIAEADLRLRGPGEILGTRQHGLPAFRIADLEGDAELVDPARRLAFDIVSGRRPVAPPVRARLESEWRRRTQNQSGFVEAG